MKLSSPKRVTWWIAFVLAILGLLIHFGILKGIAGDIGFFLVLIAYALLAVATMVRGL
jgi:uncharacterized membrane protein